MDEYRTVAGPAVAELTIKRSRFICAVAPVQDAAAAQAFIAGVTAQHKQATHNVPAYRVGLQRLDEWCSDDGEPAGTAGRPALNVLQAQDLRQVALVVTRYFGGILLGAPGLVRAYTEAAVAGVAAAGVVTMRRHKRLAIHTSYGLLGRVQYLLGELGARLVDATYGADVRLVADIRAGEAGRLRARLAEATAGQAQVEELGELYLADP